MEAICEKCSKKHTIDENLIKGIKAHFNCKGCGHRNQISAPQASPTSPAPKKREAISSRPQGAQQKKGLPVKLYLFLTMALGFILIVGTFTFLAFRYIPNIINHQIELRTQAITSSFSGGIQKSLLLRDYLQVNKEAKRTSQLPGVAYAAVVNQKGIVVGGFFSDLTRFDKQFADTIKTKGFPANILNQNKLASGADRQVAQIVMGGETILDEVVPIPDAGGHVHVGIYVSEVNDAIRSAVFSPLTISLTLIVLIFGAAIFILTSRLITKPIEELTDVVNRISLGEMDLSITPSGPREMRELSAAFDRMHQSVKYVMSKLSK